MKWWGLVLGAVLISSQALGMAVTLYAGAVTVPSTGAATVSVVTGTARKFYRVDYAAGSTTCVDWHFELPAEYTSAQALEPVLDYYTASNNAAVSVQYRIACVGESEDYETASLTSGTSQSLSAGPSDGVVQRHSAGFNAIDETGCDPLDHVILRLCRLSSDSNTDRLSVVKARLRF